MFFCEIATTNALAVSASDWQTDMWRTHAYSNTQLWWMPAKPFGMTRQFANKPPNHSTADNWNRIVSTLNAGSSSTCTHAHTCIHTQYTNTSSARSEASIGDWMEIVKMANTWVCMYVCVCACISAGTSIVNVYPCHCTLIILPFSCLCARLLC